MVWATVTRLDAKHLFTEPRMNRSLPDLPPVETERLRLRLLVPSDAEAFRVLTDEPAIIDAVNFLSAPFELAQARTLIEGDGSGQDRFWGAWHRGDEALIGTVGTHLRGDEIELGYWFAPAVQGQGLASEAVGGLVAILATACPGCSIVAECRPQNQASWRLLEKVGFRATDEKGARPGRRKLVFSR